MVWLKATNIGASSFNGLKKKFLTHGQQNSLKTCLSFGVNMGEVMSSSKHSFRGEYTINIECGPLETALV